MDTSISADRFFAVTIFSPRKIPDSATPNTGIVKPYIATFPTGLYLSSRVQRLKAIVVISAIYISRTVDFTVTESGTYTITATKNGETAEDTATITADGQTVNVKLAYRHIYGVVWDGTSTTVWSRTDAAASFVNPTPYLSLIHI